HRSPLFGSDSTKSAARLSTALNVARFGLQRHLREESSLPCFRPQNCGAVSRYSARPGRVLTISRLPRFYNKFCLQSDRSTTNAERAADLKLARFGVNPQSRFSIVPRSRSRVIDSVVISKVENIRTMQTRPGTILRTVSRSGLYRAWTTNW